MQPLDLTISRNPTSKHKPELTPITVEKHQTSEDANGALRLLGIAGDDPGFGGKRMTVS